MRKPRISACPFCGYVPKGRPNEFASTMNGPSVICHNCGSGGPAALGMDKEQEGADDEKLYKLAIEKWNRRVAP